LVGPNDLLELDRAIGLRDVAAEIRQCFDLPGRFVAVEHGQLDVTRSECAERALAITLYSIVGFNDGIAGGREEIARRSS
jgi:hypothetical protein